MIEEDPSQSADRSGQPAGEPGEKCAGQHFERRQRLGPSGTGRSKARKLDKMYSEGVLNFEAAAPRLRANRSTPDRRSANHHRWTGILG